MSGAARLEPWQRGPAPTPTQLRVRLNPRDDDGNIVPGLADLILRSQASEEYRRRVYWDAGQRVPTPAEDALADERSHRAQQRLFELAVAGDKAALDVLPVICHPAKWHLAYDVNGRPYRSRPRFKARKRYGDLSDRQKRRRRADAK